MTEQTGFDTRTRVVVTRRLPEPVETRMQALFDVRFNDVDIPLSADELVERTAHCDVLVSAITDTLDAETIGRLGPDVRLIAQFGNGYDNIDIDAAARRGITVTNTPSVLTDDTADMTMALIVAVPRRIIEGAQVLLKDGTWAGWSPTWMLGRRLGGKSLGIVGLGRIGTAVARRARAFGLSIHYFGRERKPEPLEAQLGARYWSSLDDMLAEVDIVTLHTPLNAGTRHILNAERISRMKQGAYLVNIARPELVDEAALIEAIEAGHLSGAALDVFEHKRGVDPRLLALARRHKVVLTTHMASATLESRVETGETVIVNIRTFLDGHQPPHRVLPERGSEATPTR
ncbi:2-hydroxyacid dehydrogenase [Cucumibacter marinus]|uniref:2-hydroxyacid dehydrogenase n=1 Tax=Cucumibacter marinus TaxID=1121252 RepID=UPI000686A6C0|nr:D-glycerate dehydrogenase [Cucumibacter marinus]